MWEPALRWWLEVAVDAAAVGDAECENDQLGVFDRVDDAVVADPDAPKVGVAGEYAGAWRAGISPEAFDRGGEAPCELPVELAQRFDGSRVVLDDEALAGAYCSSVRATFSAETTRVRPASMSARRLVAIAPSCASIIAS